MGDPKYANDNRDVVQPFPVGPRNCPGQQCVTSHVPIKTLTIKMSASRFALYIIKLTLAHLLWRLDLVLADGTRNWDSGQRVYNGWIQPALPVMMKKHA
jgi:aspirochlorine biosynthesis cytochrome P450 monooxygenase